MSAILVGLVGLLAIAAIVFIFHITGKIAVKYLVENDNEDDYIGHGFAVWMVIGSISAFCYVIGKIILHFI